MNDAHRLQRQRNHLIVRQGDLKVTTSRMVRAADKGHSALARQLQGEITKIKTDMTVIRQTIAQLESEESDSDQSG